MAKNLTNIPELLTIMDKPISSGSLRSNLKPISHFKGELQLPMVKTGPETENSLALSTETLTHKACDTVLTSR